jgi:hypothetical protein
MRTGYAVARALEKNFRARTPNRTNEFGPGSLFGGASMSEETLTAVFTDPQLADSAIGRLEVLGVPSRSIAKTTAMDNFVSVSAKVEDRLSEKARLILQGDGKVTT